MSCSPTKGSVPVMSSDRLRHQHVVELVFNQALPHPEDKYDLLANLIYAMNIDYSSDRETFSRLVRGRSVVAMFPRLRSVVCS